MWFILIILFCVIVVFWAAYFVKYSAIVVFINHFSDREFLNFHFSTSSILALNPLFLIVFGLSLSKLWAYLNHKKIFVSGFLKMCVGLILLGTSFLVLSIGARLHMSLTVVVFYILLLSIGEILFAPTTYAEVGLLIDSPRLQAITLSLVRLMAGVGIVFSGILAVYVAPSHHTKNIILHYKHGFLEVALFLLVAALVSSCFYILCKRK